MNVDQARHDRGIAEIDDLGSLWTLDGRAYFNDALVLHKNFPGSDYFPIFNIEESRSMKDNWMLGCGRHPLGKNGGKESANQEQDRQHCENARF